MNPRDVLIRLNPVMRGWANCFKHAVARATLKFPRQVRLASGSQLVDRAAPLEVEGWPLALH